MIVAGDCSPRMRMASSDLISPWCGEAVATLDLDGGSTAADQEVEALLGEFREPAVLVECGGCHGAANAAAASEDLLVARAAAPRLEVLQPVAAPDGVRVRIDQRGDDGVTTGIDFCLRRAGPVLALAHPDDPVAGDRDHRVLDDVHRVHGVAAGRTGSGRRGEFVDVYYQEVGVHGVQSREPMLGKRRTALDRAEEPHPELALVIDPQALDAEPRGSCQLLEALQVVFVR